MKRLQPIGRTTTFMFLLSTGACIELVVRILRFGQADS
jgi:hypothetical protein